MSARDATFSFQHDDKWDRVMSGRLTRLALAAMSAVVLASCQIDTEKQNKLLQQGWANFFAMAAR